MTNKQKQIEELAEEIYQNSPCACLDYDETKMVAGWLYKAGYRKQSGWISVDERLPDKSMECLIYTTVYFTPDHVNDCDHYNVIEVAHFFPGHGFISDNGFFAKAWMPLPEPPKTKGEHHGR